VVDGRTVYGCDTAPLEMTARDALHLATRGGAQVLGRADIGQITPGYCADLALFDLRTRWAMAGGAVHDAMAACCCAPARLRATPSCTAGRWCAMASSPRWSWGPWWKGTTAWRWI
jgi:predicted amidohydrolase